MITFILIMNVFYQEQLQWQPCFTTNETRESFPGNYHYENYPHSLTVPKLTFYYLFGYCFRWLWRDISRSNLYWFCYLSGHYLAKINRTMIHMYILFNNPRCVLFQLMNSTINFFTRTDDGALSILVLSSRNPTPTSYWKWKRNCLMQVFPPLL